MIFNSRPKNGAVFTPGSTIRLEFPAQGYVNPLNTTLQFDATIYGPTTPNGTAIRFQNNIQSIFSRGRVMYGSTPLEDLINMNTIVRFLTEWTATNVQGILDQTSIAEGIGGYVLGCDSSGVQYGFVNSRTKFIQSVTSNVIPAVGANFTGGQELIAAGMRSSDDLPGGSADPNGRAISINRYQINLPFGLMTQDKVILKTYTS